MSSPLSQKAQEERRPQAQVQLLEAEQDRPEVLAKARLPLRTYRTAQREGA